MLLFGLFIVSFIAIPNHFCAYHIIPLNSQFENLFYMIMIMKYKRMTFMLHRVSDYFIRL